MQIQNRFVPAVTELFEEWHVHSKLLMDEYLVIATHGNDKIRPFYQLAGQFARHVFRHIDTFFTKAVPDPGVHRLGFGLNTRRSNQAEVVEPEMQFCGILGDDATEDIPAADKENRPHWFVTGLHFLSY